MLTIDGFKIGNLHVGGSKPIPSTTIGVVAKHILLMLHIPTRGEVLAGHSYTST